MSTVSGIQGHLLDVTVVGCYKLKDTEWISRQDPYVCLEYASTKFRTRTCTDGGKNPVFQEKTVIPLIEGLREISVAVWNSNTLTLDDFIGTGKVQLQKVLSGGYDDSAWPLQSKSGKFAGEVKLIMHYPNAHAQKPQKAGSATPAYMPPVAAHPPYGGANYTHPPTTAHYPPVGAYNAASPYHPPASYPPSAMDQHYAYPHTAYPQQPYPPPQQAQPYPPPQQAQPYPPPHQVQPYHYPPSSGAYPGAYPPPPPPYH